MNNKAILDRINEVLIIDAVAADRVNFLSVHTPFENILYSQSGNAENLIDRISEDEIYNKFLLGSSDEHKFIIVRGDNGTGKSHLIRVLSERYKKDFDSANEELIFIAKYQSTLRGTIEQLLKIDIIKNTSKAEEIRSLIEANDHLDDVRLKDNIIHQFTIEVEHSEEDIDRRIKKGLGSLMLDPIFKIYLLRENGPIDRIYSKLIAKDSDKINDDIDPIFYENDFILEHELLSNIRSGGASRDTMRLAERLAKDDAIELSREIAKILNNNLDRVIQTCTNLRSTDLNRVFLNIRKELKKQGKTLTLFIEDITSFTGVDKAIIDILVAPHKGIEQNAELCRICSFVGITTTYYKNNFPAHLQDRVTDQLFIGEDSFGSVDNLKEMAGRYINAVYQKKEVFENWVSNGSEDNEVPVLESNEFPIWDYVELENGKIFTLYPFTENSLINLYNNLEQKSPRLFIKEVIKKYLVYYYLDKSKFLSVVNVQLPGWNPPSHGMSLQNQADRDEYKRLDNIFRLWGDGTIYKINYDNYETIGGLNTEFFKIIEATIIKGIDSDRGNKVVVKPPTPIIPNPSTAPPTPKPIENDEYSITKMDIENWAIGEPLKNFIKLRDALYQFIVSSIDWQLEGVSSYIKGQVLKKALFAIEDQAQGLQNAKLLLKRSQQGRMVLLGLASWLYQGNKTWNFEGSTEYQLHLVNWLLSIKEELLNLIKDPYKEIGYNEELLLKFSLTVDYYRLAIAGDLNGEESLYEIYYKLMRDQLEFKKLESHSDNWRRTAVELQTSDYSENHNLVIKYFKCLIGDAVDRADKNFIDSQLLLEKIKSCSLNNWEITIEKLDELSVNEDNVYILPLKLLKKQLKLLDVTFVEEKKKSQKIINVLYDNLDIVDDGNIKLVLRKIKGYLTTLSEEFREPFDANLLNTCNNLLGKYEEIYENYTKLQIIVDNDKIFSNKMAILSSNPYMFIEEFSTLLSGVYDLTNEIKEKYENKDKLQQGRIQSQDITVDMVKSKISNLYNMYKATKGVLDNVN